MEGYGAWRWGMRCVCVGCGDMGYEGMAYTNTYERTELHINWPKHTRHA